VAGGTGVVNGVLGIATAQVVLNEAQIVAAVGEGETAGIGSVHYWDSGIR
jgi:hypothetical protein